MRQVSVRRRARDLTHSVCKYKRTRHSCGISISVVGASGPNGPHNALHRHCYCAPEVGERVSCKFCSGVNGLIEPAPSNADRSVRNVRDIRMTAASESGNSSPIRCGSKRTWASPCEPFSILVAVGSGIALMRLSSSGGIMPHITVTG